MIKIFEANALKVSIFTGFLFLILFVPFACFKLTQTVVDSHPQMQDLLQGKTLEQYRNEIDKQADEIDSQNQEDIEEELAEAMQNLEDGNEEVQKAMQQLAQMQRDMKLGEKILPPCYHQLIDKNDDKNPVFVLIGTQVSLLGMSPKEERQQGIQSLHQQIDQYSGAAEGPMAISEAEKQCLQEIKANLSKIN